MDDRGGEERSRRKPTKAPRIPQTPQAETKPCDIIYYKKNYIGLVALAAHPSR